MSGEEPAAKPKRGKSGRYADPGANLAKAVEELAAALNDFEEAGLDPMALLDQLRAPLEAVDGAATRMRELRRAGIVETYPDRTVPVYRISEAAGLESAMVTRYAKQAGLELRNRRTANP